MYIYTQTCIYIYIYTYTLSIMYIYIYICIHTLYTGFVLFVCVVDYLRILGTGWDSLCPVVKLIDVLIL